MANEGLIRAILSDIAEITGKSISEKLVKTWVEVMADETKESLIVARKKCLSEWDQDRIPLPAEFLRYRETQSEREPVKVFTQKEIEQAKEAREKFLLRFKKDYRGNYEN